MSLSYRSLDVDELALVAEIDRTEAIDTLYVQEGALLREVRGDFSAAAWDPVGTGEHSVAAQCAELARYVEKGAICVGAFGDRLIGIGVVLPHLRPGVAQLAYLYVTDGRRGEGVGAKLTDELERLAREAGSHSIVVSATPSRNTVDFYRRRGYEPMAEPLPELYELEPDDVHLEKAL
jgi:GNAT superfamily N-acetyltransferase